MIECHPSTATGSDRSRDLLRRPEPLADELYDKLAAYYEDDPNVDGDRRPPQERAPRRAAARPAASARCATGGAPRVAGEFPPHRRRRRSLSREASSSTWTAARAATRARPPRRPCSRRRTATSSTRPRSRSARATNNVAEYRGLLLGLERARGARRHRGRGRQRLRADRPPGQRPLQGQAPRHEAAARRGAATRCGGFERWSIRSVPRAQNADADALVNQALDARAAASSRSRRAAPSTPPTC